MDINVITKEQKQSFDCSCLRKIKQLSTWEEELLIFIFCLLNSLT